ncbi:scarecrow-like protein 32 [Morus notabilis]|nr:scarecrow-like protein 32 [Morus notabilis]
MMNKNQILHHHRGSSNSSRPWPGFTTSKALGVGGGGGSGGSSFGDANCMEQLLVHCANAIEANDVTLAQQILWVLNNIAPPDGDANQRLACGFLRALVSRAARTGACNMLPSDGVSVSVETHRFSVIELANFIDLTPWHRFGFTAANAAILDAVEGRPVVHIVDLSLTHCMQIPTLVDSIATRHHNEVPPLIKLTVAAECNYSNNDAVSLPPALDLSYEELGAKLVNFARSRNIVLEFRVIPSSYSDGFASLIEQLRVQNLVYSETGDGEALVINCHMKLHHIPEETTLLPLRTMFLKAIRSLDPTVVVLVDEDADLTSNNLVCRLRSAFNYLWIPYDTVDTFLPKGSKQRQWYEADICWKIENVLANEGIQRVERLEPKAKWVQRMRNARFRSVSFGEEAVAEVKAMLDEHAAGWGVKREDEDLVLTWKGHNVVFATVWVSA